MKTNRFERGVCGILVLCGLSVAPLGAATFIKANNTTTLSLNGSWVGGTAQPGATDLAQWDSTVTTANTVSFGTDRTIGGISILNPGGNVAITTSGTATFGNLGIDMSSATVDLALTCWVRLGASQSWTIGSGRTLTITGTTFGNSGTAYTLTKAGAGTLTMGVQRLQLGDTILSAGTFNINHNQALGTAAYSLTISGLSTIDNTSGANITMANANPYYWNADFTFTGTTNLNLGTGAVTLNASRIVTVSNNGSF